MAEALLRAQLEARGVAARVRSAGTLQWHGYATPHAVHVMRERGLDLSAHRSEALSTAMVVNADLALGMARAHVDAIVARDASARERAFLVDEVVRLGQKAGPRAPGESLRAWAARVAALRPRSGVIGRAADEIADPVGESLAVYRATADRLDAVLGHIMELISPRCA